MDKREDLELAGDEALWKLLGQARPPTVSPYFSRRVLRAVAAAEEEAEARAGQAFWRRWLAALTATKSRAAWSAATATAMLLLTGLLPLLPFSWQAATAARHRRPAATTAISTGGAASMAAAAGALEPAAAPSGADSLNVSEQDVSVIAELDDLLDSQENRVWLDDDSAS